MLPERHGVRDQAGSAHGERHRREGAVRVLCPGFRSFYSKALTSAVALSTLLKHASEKSGKVLWLRRQENNSSHTVRLYWYTGVGHVRRCKRMLPLLYSRYSNLQWRSPVTQDKNKPCVFSLSASGFAGATTPELSAAAAGLPRPRQAGCPGHSSWRLAV